MIVSVYVSECPYHIDKPYSYILPFTFQHSAKIGCRVIVPFGGGNKKKVGLLSGFSEEAPANITLKPVIALLDPEPILSQKQLDLCDFVKDHYFCTFFEAAALMFPPGSTVKFKQSIIFNESCDQDILGKYELKPNYQQIIQYVKEKAPLSKDELANQFENSLGRINTLIRLGIFYEQNDLKTQMGTKTKKTVSLHDHYEEALEKVVMTKRSAPKYHMVIGVLANNGSLSIDELTYLSGSSLTVVTTMVKKGVLTIYESPVYRNRFSGSDAEYTADTLSEEQNEAYKSLHQKLTQNKPSCTLLKGVTGSGKTHVFLKLIEDVLKNNRTALVLLPEISLTTQMTDRFFARFGNLVGVLHSAMSMRDRYDTWQRIESGEIKIVIGTRLAVFSPLSDIGLIVIDEEQETTYKSEMPPKYDAREIAKFRCVQENAMLLLTSATPSLESIYQVKNHKYGYLELTKRYNEALLPKVIISDMTKQLREGNTSLFSRELQALLEENVKNKNQSVLFINRRGYSPYVVCRSCGYVAKCPNCSISLTYHRDNGRLMCHYCGHNAPLFTACPACKDTRISLDGYGTQKVEQELLTFLPEARILRMDSDSIRRYAGHEEIFNDFREGKYDILLGTQMVAKGLDFENVTLVGVILADLSLNLDDYRANENTFALLTQVAGRAGRGRKEGTAVIQTNEPGNRIIGMAARQDFEGFYKEELEFRRMMEYPPFFDLCQVIVCGQTDGRTAKVASQLARQLSLALTDSRKYVTGKVISAAASPIRKINNLYRYRILIKCRNDKNFRILMKRFLNSFSVQKGNKSFSVSVDINPYSML